MQRTIIRKEQGISTETLGKLLILLVLSLTCIGLIFIYAASSVFAAEKFSTAAYFLRKQLFSLIPALLGALFFAFIPLRILKPCTPYLFLGSLLVCSLTFISSAGLKIHGSHRWLYIGSYGFQPSEFLKLCLFMYLGFFLQRKESKVTSLMHGYLPFLCILGITFFVLLKQPDFGTVVTIFATALLLFFVAEFSMTHLITTILCSCPLVVAAIIWWPYRLQRVLTFFDPWSDPQGRGYQIIQSLIAIGSGNVWGLGIGNSQQKFFYLPMQHTDFIFSIIAEETGFIGVSIIMLLYMLFWLVGIKIALRFTDPFAFFTTLGFVMLLSLQALINFMVVSGMVPTKGLGLPFISYGGTALIASYCMIGLILNFIRHARS